MTGELATTVALHLGAHKTATTHLQRSLRAAKGAFATSGLSYLDPADLRGDGYRLGFIAPGGPHTQAAAQAFERGVAGAGRLLLSEENLLGVALEGPISHDLYPQAGERLARVMVLLGERPAQLFLAVRDPAEFLVSSYGQRLISGQAEPFEVYRGGRDPAKLRWSELVKRLLQVEGVEGLTIWRYEDWPGIAPAVLARMLPAGLAEQVQLIDELVHPGLSARGVDWLMAEHAQGRSGRDVARMARARFPKGPGEPGFMPLDAATRARAAQSYAEDFAAIDRLPKVTSLTSAKA